MSIDRPTLPALVARAETDLSGRLLDGATPLPRSVVAVLARVLAGQTHLLYGYLEWLAAQPFVDAAEAEYLERHGSTWGVARKAAVAAAGSVSLTGTDGAVLPAGTELQRVDGVLYTTDAEATVAAGVAVVAITAREAGEAGNTAAGLELTLTSPVTAMQSTAVVASGGLTGGTDAEGDAALRARILARIQTPPMGGSKADYEAWALAVPGVTRAWVYPRPTSGATVWVAIVADDADDGPIPSTELVAAAQEYIDSKRPVTAEAVVFAPAPLVVPITMALSPDTPATRAAVAAELGDLFAREAEPDGTIYLSHLREAISVSAGEVDHTITSPTADIVATGLQFPVLGTITFA